MFVFQTEIPGKYIVLVLTSLLFYFFSSLHRGDQSTVFCTVCKSADPLKSHGNEGNPCPSHGIYGHLTSFGLLALGVFDNLTIKASDTLKHQPKV